MAPSVKSASEILQQYEDEGKIVHLTKEQFDKMQENLNSELEKQKDLYNYLDQESYNQAATFRFG